MDRIDEHSAELPRSTHAPQDGAKDSFREAADRLREEFDATIGALKRSAYIEKQSFGLTVFDVALRGGLLAAAGAAVLALAVSAAWLLVSSTRRGLALWTNDAWWGDLVLAVAIVAVLGGSAYFVRRSVHKSVLSKTRRKLAASAPGMRDDPQARNGAASPSRRAEVAT
jgi:hypothetical protein